MPHQNATKGEDLVQVELRAPGREVLTTSSGTGTGVPRVHY